MAREYIKGFRYGQRRRENYLDESDIVTRNQNPLAKLAREARKKLPTEFKESLCDLICRLNPGWVAPIHLQPLIDTFEKVQRGERVRFLFSVPPRHAKSFTVMHGIIRYFLTHRNKNVMYLCYNQQLAEDQSRQIRERIERAGLKFTKDTNAVASWKLNNGCTFRATGIIGGQITGYPADLIIVDDPYKERSDVESVTMRRKVMDAFQAAAISRMPQAIIVIHCIAKDEPVLMADGSWKPIQDVVVGDYVASLEDDNFVSRKVLASKSQGLDQVYKIDTERKSVRANARHPFLTEGGWKKVSELSIEDKLRVVTSGYGDSSVDPDYAWFFGFMMGDGWVTQWKRKSKTGNVTHSYCVCAARGVHEDINERVIRCFEKFFGKTPKLTKAGYYRLDSNSAGKQLLKEGLTGGAWGKRVPEWVFKLTPSLKVEYLRGYADADGCAAARCKDSHVVASVSKDLISDTRKLAISAGVRNGKIMCHSQTVKAPNSKEAKVSTLYKLRLNFTSVDSFEKIKSIQEDGISEVFDLTVEGAENFIVDGLVSHNTRWHQDDLISNLSKLPGYEYVNVPAISVDGAPLWPEVRPLSDLEEAKSSMSVYDWSALFLGNPVPRGQALFNELPETNYYNYEDLPKNLKYSIGIDLAYTAKTHADYSVAIVMATDGVKHYVIDVLRKQCDATTFAKELERLRSRLPNSPMISYISGPEKGSISLLNSRGLNIIPLVARTDKFDRAQTVSAGWNNGKIFLPAKKQAWQDAFISEILHFSGLNDPQDDQVDAFAGAYAGIVMPRQRRNLRNLPSFR